VHGNEQDTAISGNQVSSFSVWETVQRATNKCVGAIQSYQWHWR